MNTKKPTAALSERQRTAEKDARAFDRMTAFHWMTFSVN
jgi:hypothetical protein